MSSGVACSISSLAAASLTQEQQSRSSTENCSSTENYCHPSACERRPAPEGMAGGLDASINAEKVLRAFNTWAFKREQPSDPQLMLRFIAEAIAAQEPLQFVLYWGKGPRHEVGVPEIQCLDFLDAMTSRVQAVYTFGAALTLILTDTHAELNGYSRQDIQQYFADITSVARQRGIQTCRLSSLVKAAGHLAIAAPVEETVPPETLSTLVASAQKWYRGPGTAAEGALAYLRINLIERRVVERTFPNSIFITFNGSDLRSLFPHQLPIFYMYSLRRGMSVKPWFLPSEPTKSKIGADQSGRSRPRST